MLFFLSLSDTDIFNERVLREMYVNVVTKKQTCIFEVGIFIDDLQVSISCKQ